MSNDIRGPELVRDDAVTEALRGVYAAPTDPAYWTALEARIMGALDDADAWWSVGERWTRWGLAAAAAAVLLAAGLFLRAQNLREQELAIDAVIEEVPGLESALAQREPISAEQATLRRLTGHQ
ncbi:MAG: hypothetical protein FJ202_00300 [Gemmatimonadetes bacterium]|nr:hypothetical protein [Gemmatimonadota bacterium]